MLPSWPLWLEGVPATGNIGFPDLKLEKTVITTQDRISFAACYAAVELLFNLAWLALAAALLFLYGARAPSFAAEHRRITSAIALACILALLFPVISISDDLSCNPDLAESNASKKWVAAATLARPPLSAWLGTPPPVRGARREAALDAGCRAQSPALSSSNLNRRPPPALS